MTAPTIIFVPGLKPKPPPEIYGPELQRVLAAALERNRPGASKALVERTDTFVVIGWTSLFYGSDVELDRSGIAELVSGQQPTEEDLRDIDAWSQRLLRRAHVVGDAVPALGRLFASPATRLMMHDASRYLKNRAGIAGGVRALLHTTLESAWRAGKRVLLVGHSLGSVIAYDTLWELSHRAAAAEGRIELFITLGSPLGTHFIRRSLQGAHAEGVERYPTNVDRWLNFAARGDTTALHPRLRPFFREMLDLGLIQTIEDHVELTNHFRGSGGLNVHEVFGYLAQPAVAAAIAAWLEAGP